MAKKAAKKPAKKVAKKAKKLTLKEFAPLLCRLAGQKESNVSRIVFMRCSLTDTWSFSVHLFAKEL